MGSRSEGLKPYSLLNLRRAVHKLMVPELELWVADHLNEGDEQPPRMWTVDYESFQ